MSGEGNECYRKGGMAAGQIIATGEKRFGEKRKRELRAAFCVARDINLTNEGAVNYVTLPLSGTGGGRRNVGGLLGVKSTGKK